MSTHIQAINSTPTRLVRWTQGAFNSFLRALALCFVGLSIHIWLTAIGYWEGANFQFDTMAMDWKVYTAVLMVLIPITSVGLWTTLPWGRVVWFLAIGFQIVAWMRFELGSAMGEQLVLFHLVTLGIYVIFQLALSLITKER